MQQKARHSAPFQTGKERVQAALVVRVAAVHDYVCVLRGGGEDGEAVVVAVEDADAGVEGGEGGGDAAEERGEGPVWVRLHERGQDGAADVACCAGAGGGGVRWGVYRLGEGCGTGRVWGPWWMFVDLDVEVF